MKTQRLQFQCKLYHVGEEEVIEDNSSGHGFSGEIEILDTDRLISPIGHGLRSYPLLDTLL